MADMKVFFATNRNLKSDGEGAVKNSALSPTGPRFGIHPGDFRVGTANVKIKKLNQDVFGEKKLKDTAHFKSATLGKERRNKNGVFTKRGSDIIYPNLITLMRDCEIRRAEEGVRWSALVFIPGFNYTFEESIERGALLAHIYASEHHRFVPFVFSWPSDGKLLFAYNDDRLDAECSGPAAGRAYKQFIKHLASRDRSERCLSSAFLVAHSMGAYALRYAVQQVVTSDWAVMPLFDAAILAAPDIDQDALEINEKLLPLAKLAQQVVIYVHRQDVALKHAANPPRLGKQGPSAGARQVFSVPISTVRCEHADLREEDGTMHQYYRMSPYVVRDIRAVLDGIEADEIAHRKQLGTSDFRLLKK